MMHEGQPVRVLLADDSALMRNLISRILIKSRVIEVIGKARDGEDVVRKARELKPDVITMDINMPRLDGITAMQMILGERICPVVMFSSLTQQGALETFECLELGAFDFVAKPGGTVSSNIDGVADELVAKILAAAKSHRRPGRVREPRVAVRREPARKVDTSGAVSSRAVAIGISTGGPATISTVLPQLAKDLPAAVFLVQHMPAAFIRPYVARLQKECAIEVVEAKSGALVQPGCCYVAGNDLHLCVYRKLTGEIVIRTPSQPRTLFVPSVDVMMQSVLSVYGAGTVGVLMTGIGDDGADQMVAVRGAGGKTIAESEDSCVVFGMPYQAIRRGGADFVLPSWEIAEKVTELVSLPVAETGTRTKMRGGGAATTSSNLRA